jgi:hypothetical protein
MTSISTDLPYAAEAETSLGLEELEVRRGAAMEEFLKLAASADSDSLHPRSCATSTTRRSRPDTSPHSQSSTTVCCRASTRPASPGPVPFVTETRTDVQDGASSSRRLRTCKPRASSCCRVSLAPCCSCFSNLPRTPKLWFGYDLLPFDTRFFFGNIATWSLCFALGPSNMTYSLLSHLPRAHHCRCAA